MKIIYDQIKMHLKTLDFNGLNQGFKPYPFALYNHESFYFKDGYHPITDQFRGNTTIQYQGAYIAIWNMTYDPNINIYELTAGMVHEMYHAHQMTHHKSDYPEDFKIIREDLSIDYLYLLQREALSLIKASLSQDLSFKKDCLKELIVLRQNRKKLNSSLFQQELNLENFEGIAEYVGYKALLSLDPDQAKKKFETYIEHLKSMNHLLNLRWLTYGKSVLFFSILESLDFSFKNVDQVTNPNYYEDLLNDLSQESIPLIGHGNKEEIYQAITEIYHAFQENNKKIIEDFHKKKPSKINIEGRICGYDPLNMIAYEDFLYCKHFIALDFGKGPEFIQGPLLLKLDSLDPMKIAYYYL